MAGQRFVITLDLLTECDEKLTLDDVRKWIADRFEGCDVGDVVLMGVKERFQTPHKLDCCEKAHHLDCVCYHATKCTEHGERHVGTHD